MATYTTEIASDKLISDNPIHQRLLKAYIAAQPWISGKLLEVGCGEGRGVEILLPHATGYLGIDKIQEVIDMLRSKFPPVRCFSAGDPQRHRGHRHPARSGRPRYLPDPQPHPGRRP